MSWLARATSQLLLYYLKYYSTPQTLKLPELALSTANPKGGGDSS